MSSEGRERAFIGSPERLFVQSHDGSNPPIAGLAESGVLSQPDVIIVRDRSGVPMAPTEAKSDATIRWQSFTIGDQLLLDSIRAADRVSIVTVTISVVPSHQDGQLEWLVVEKTFDRPVDRSDWSVLLPGWAGKEWAASDSAAKEWQEAFNRWAAKKLVDSVWEQSTKRWGGDDIASILGALGGLQDQYHERVLGQPVQLGGELIGLNPVTAAALKGIVSEHPLPGDSWMTDLKYAIDITGIGVGLSLPNPCLVHTCVNSLVRDLVTDAISEQLAKLFRPPPRTETVDLP